MFRLRLTSIITVTGSLREVQNVKLSGGINEKKHLYSVCVCELRQNLLL